MAIKRFQRVGVIAMTKHFEMKNKFSAGFTMVEMAMVLTIVGIVISGAAIAYPRYVYQLQVAQTNRQLDTIMNVLSVYAQRHNRLPCPALATGNGSENLTVTTATGANTSCYDPTNATAFYQNTQGVLPWRELGLPESMARDAWGRLITYKPAAQLTLDNSDWRQQDITNADSTAIHNACRGPKWFTMDAAGNPEHVNRGQALFCCNALAKPAYKSGGGPLNWRNQSVRAAGQNANQSVIQTPAWMDPSGHDADGALSSQAGTFNGRFNEPRQSGFAGQTQPLIDSPLIRASTNAVTLISHGNNGFMANILGSTELQQEGNAKVSPVERANATDYANTAGTVYNVKLSGSSYDTAGLRPGASDDIVSYMRSDQLYAKAGRASCQPQVVNHNCTAVATDDAKPMQDVSFVLDTSGSMGSTVKCQPGSSYCGKTLNYVTQDSMNWLMPKLIEMKLEGDPNSTDTINVRSLNSSQANGINLSATLDPVNVSYYDSNGVYIPNNATVAQLSFSIQNNTSNSPIAQRVLEMVQTVGVPTEPGKPNVVVLLTDGENNAPLTLPCTVGSPNCGNNGTITYPFPTACTNSNSGTCRAQKAAANLAIMNALTAYITANFPGVEIYGVQVGPLLNAAANPGDAQNLKNLSEATGGKYIPVSFPDDLKSIFDSIVHNTILTCL